MTPERLGKYEIRGALGEGGMGMVYDGWDPLILRRVAIKTVSLAQGDDEDAAEGRERFRREAQAAGRLQHPNIVSVYDFGAAEALEYIVMEFMDGGTLKEVLDRERKLPVAQACDMMGQVLAALAYSHARGVIHRDVKPANIMLDSHGAVKLGDFGIARLDSSSMTMVGDVLGTPAYMAPEQFLGDTADARSDIFAAGATLFHLVTGTRPYEGSRTAVRQKVLTATIAPSATDRAAEVPPALDTVLRRAMARLPADRYQTATEFFGAMRVALLAPMAAEQVADDATVFMRPGADATEIPPKRQSPPPSPTPHSGPPMAVLAGGAALLLAAVAGGAWYFASSPKVAVVPRPITEPPATEPPPRQPSKSAPLTPVDAARAVSNAAARVECALLRLRTGDAKITVAGIARAGDLPDLRDEFQKAAAGFEVDLQQLQTFTSPYCEVLRNIRAAWDEGSMTLALQNQNDLGVAPRNVLHNNEFMKPVLGGLNFAAYVRVDDFTVEDGNVTVTHMYPRRRQAADIKIGQEATAADPSKLVPNAGTLALGSLPHTRFPVGSPFGTDLVISVASSEKLDIADRSNSEKDPAAYLAALGQAIDTAVRHGAKLAAGAITVETVEK